MNSKPVGPTIHDMQAANDALYSSDANFPEGAHEMAKQSAKANKKIETEKHQHGVNARYAERVTNRAAQRAKKAVAGGNAEEAGWQAKHAAHNANYAAAERRAISGERDPDAKVKHESSVAAARHLK